MANKAVHESVWYGAIYSFQLNNRQFVKMHSFTSTANSGSKFTYFNNCLYGQTYLGGVNNVGYIVEYNLNTSTYLFIESKS